MTRRAVTMAVSTLLALVPLNPLAAATPDLPPPPGLQELVAEVAEAWRVRSPERFASLWRFAPDDRRADEVRWARERTTADDVRSRVRVLASADGYRVLLQLFTIREPRGRLEEWSLRVEPRGDRWAIVDRTALAEVGGLSHVTLDPDGYRADGRRIVLEDFELELEEGSLFTSPPNLGPTALTFVGKGTVRFRPAPEAERRQLDLFAGRPELVETVTAAFIRIHPADFNRFLPGGPLVPDPEAGRRLDEARRFHDRHVGRMYVLDASLPRSPWWVLPSLGDAAVTFATRKKGTLTFSVFNNEPESISLSDRERRRQICLYPSAGREADYREDAGRPYDVAHHELSVRLQPQERAIDAVDEITLDVRQPVSTVQLALDGNLRVQSVTSSEGGEHLFFRVRHQDSVMVSLGALAGRTGAVKLRVSYSGSRDSEELDRELLQIAEVGAERDIQASRDFPAEDVLVYSSRSNWYPQAGRDDYATANVVVDVPADYVAITGGQLREQADRMDRRVFRYEQPRPAKYLALAVGRFAEVGRSRAGDVDLTAWSVRRAKGDAQRMMSELEGMVEFFTSLFGPLPYPTLQLVLTEGLTPGGHSPPGMLVMRQRWPFDRRPLMPDPAEFHDIAGFFLAHELAHQWWGHGVAGQNYRERWLSEAMAHYAAALWTRHRHGEETFRGVLRRMARWARRENDAGPIHLGQRLGHVDGDARVFRAVVYDKGAYVLHMLRQIVGEAAFGEGLRSLQQRYRFQKIGTRDLQQALEQAWGRAPLDRYFDAWVYGTELPELDFSHRSESASAGHRTVLRVEARNLPGPVPVSVVLKDGGERAYDVTVEPGTTVHTFLTQGQPRKVELNEDLGLLATVSRR